MNENKVKILPPFKRFCVTIGNLPSSYVESMTYYECLMWLCKYLQETVIPAVNENASAVNDLINWFNTLDVQDEIDNKLDEMAESGQLEEIMAEYLNANAVFGFDNVSAMKSSENLINGSFAKTLGFYEVNDGGSATYKIREISNSDVVDECFILAMSDENLVAELVFNNEINLSQVGLKGDGTTDDTEKFQTVLDFARTNNLRITSTKNKTYLVSETLNVSNLYLDLHSATITTESEIDILSINSTTYFTTLKNINIDCNNVAESGIDILMGRKALLENINIDKVENVGINYHNGYELIVNNINIYGNTTSNHNVGLLCDGGDSYFNNVIIIDVLKAIVNKTAFNYFNNVHAWMYHNSNILNSVFIEVDDGNRVVLENCYCDTYRYCIYQKSSVPVLLINNFVCVYNRGLLTPTILGENHPYFLYSEAAGGNSQTRVSNANIDGYSAEINTLLTNQSSFTGEIVNSIIVNCDHNTSFAPISESNNTAGVTITASNLAKVGKVVCVDGQFKMDTTSTKTFTIGTIPYYFRPSHEIVSCCSYGSRYGFTGMCYLYINTNGRISVTFPDTVTGQQTVKVNETYITTTEV